MTEVYLYPGLILGLKEFTAWKLYWREPSFGEPRNIIFLKIVLAMIHKVDNLIRKIA